MTATKSGELTLLSRVSEFPGNEFNLRNCNFVSPRKLLFIKQRETASEAHSVPFQHNVLFVRPLCYLSRRSLLLFRGLYLYLPSGGHRNARPGLIRRSLRREVQLNQADESPSPLTQFKGRRRGRRWKKWGKGNKRGSKSFTRHHNLSHAFMSGQTAGLYFFFLRPRGWEGEGIIYESPRRSEVAN